MREDLSHGLTYTILRMCHVLCGMLVVANMQDGCTEANVVRYLPIWCLPAPVVQRSLLTQYKYSVLWER